MRGSAKTRMIVQLLKYIKEVSGGREKTVIFSQFTSMLDIIESFLPTIDVNYVRCKYMYQDRPTIC